jgi:hypothetical protein
VLRIGVGLLVVGGGLFYTVASFGLALIPGLALISVGTDQIITGIANIASSQQAPSVFEFGGYSAARGLGYDEQMARTVGVWTPVAIALPAWFVGGWLTRVAQACMEGQVALLGSPTPYQYGVDLALKFKGMRDLSLWQRLAPWISPSAIWARARLLFSVGRFPQFVFQGTVAEARPILAQLTIMTGREVALLRLADGSSVIRLGFRSSVSAAEAVEVLAHTHPQGLLVLSNDIMTYGRVMTSTDTLILRNLGQTQTWLISPLGNTVRWLSPDASWSLGSLFYEIIPML